MHNKHILLAEDSDDLRQVLLLQLQAQGAQVTAVANGQLALDALAKAPFDYLLTDLIMPEMDGMVLITKARKLYPSVQIVAMSGGGNYRVGDNSLKAARLLGAHATIAKPFSSGELQATMAQLAAP